MIFQKPLAVIYLNTNWIQEQQFNNNNSNWNVISFEVLLVYEVGKHLIKILI